MQAKASDRHETFSILSPKDDFNSFFFKALRCLFN